MSDLIKIVTCPDVIFDKSRKVFSICPGADLVNKLEDWAVDQEDSISLYYFNDKDTDLKWLMTIANISDLIILDIDYIDGHTNHFLSYLLGFTKTYYRCSHMQQPWNLINTNRFYDFPSI
jgi:hypothetical protein